MVLGVDDANSVATQSNDCNWRILAVKVIEHFSEWPIELVKVR